MKIFLIAAWLSVSSSMVWAARSTHTYYANGKYVTCTTCCYGNNCSTNLFEYREINCGRKTIRCRCSAPWIWFSFRER